MHFVLVWSSIEITLSLQAQIWTRLKNGLKRAISEFCIRDTRWLNFFHHLDNFGNNESYFFCDIFWCVPQERSRKCILHHFQFASFAFCNLIRISDYKMHQCIQSLMHAAVHTLEDHLLDFAKSVVKPIRPVLFCRESSIPSKFHAETEFDNKNRIS